MALEEFLHGGNTVRYTREGAGPPVLMLHNGGTSKEIWSAQAEALSVRHEVFCMDLLGFGESDVPRSGYLITDHVDLLEAFVEDLDVGRISVVGNCMGSAMTLLLAERRPDLFAALVLINPLTAQTARRGVIGWAMWIPRVFPRLSIAVSRLIRAPRLLGPAIVAVQFGPKRWWSGLLSPAPGARVAGATWTRKGRLVALAELFTDMRDFERVDGMRPGPGFPPFAVVWGASNLGLNPRAGAALNETLRPDRVEFLPGCGHLPMLEEPDVVTAIIEDFVENPPVRLASAAVDETARRAE